VYKTAPPEELKEDIDARFEELCATRTSFATLGQALKRLHRNKAELLLVLEKPWLPLHNNLSESDIREYASPVERTGYYILCPSASEAGLEPRRWTLSPSPRAS
jgi:hypothetical protein